MKADELQNITKDYWFYLTQMPRDAQQDFMHGLDDGKLEISLEVGEAVREEHRNLRSLGLWPKRFQLIGDSTEALIAIVEAEKLAREPK
jgi:hypothetical protein